VFLIDIFLKINQKACLIPNPRIGYDKLFVWQNQ